jgi:hypothetical protein
MSSQVALPALLPGRDRPGLTAATSPSRTKLRAPRTLITEKRGMNSLGAQYTARKHVE